MDKREEDGILSINAFNNIFNQCPLGLIVPRKFHLLTMWTNQGDLAERWLTPEPLRPEDEGFPPPGRHCLCPHTRLNWYISIS